MQHSALLYCWQWHVAQQYTESALFHLHCNIYVNTPQVTLYIKLRVMLKVTIASHVITLKKSEVWKWMMIGMDRWLVNFQSQGFCSGDVHFWTYNYFANCILFGLWPLPVSFLFLLSSAPLQPHKSLISSSFSIIFLGGSNFIHSTFNCRTVLLRSLPKS